MLPTSLKGPEIAPTSGVVKRLVIFLHGVGADGNDLLSLAEMLDLPDTQFVSPHAPFQFDMAPYGYQWFSLLDRAPAKMLGGIQKAAPILNAYIDAQIARFQLKSSQVALVGFSQGAMMSLYVAPRRAQPLAGVVAMSGAMLGTETLGEELKSKTPVCLIHGAMDEVVPFAAMAFAQASLQAHDIEVQAHTREELGHGIDAEAIDITAEFLKERFDI